MTARGGVGITSIHHGSWWHEINMGFCFLGGWGNLHGQESATSTLRHSGIKKFSHASRDVVVAAAHHCL